MRHITLALIVVAFGGCASIGTTHAIATPWAVAGVHSFGVAQPAETSERKVDAQVAKLLDAQPVDDQHSDKDTMVATR